MHFWELRRDFLAYIMAVTMITVNPIDLVVSFLWSRRRSQSEFSIKSYVCLNLRWSNFGFNFFILSSFLFSFFFSVLHLSFIYEIGMMKSDNLWNLDFWILVFRSSDRDERMIRLKNIAIRGSRKLEFHWLISLEPVIS
jgi:hypothetical protein